MRRHGHKFSNREIGWCDCWLTPWTLPPKLMKPIHRVGWNTSIRVHSRQLTHRTTFPMRHLLAFAEMDGMIIICCAFWQPQIYATVASPYPTLRLQFSNKSQILGISNERSCLFTVTAFLVSTHWVIISPATASQYFFFWFYLRSICFLELASLLIWMQT